MNRRVDSAAVAGEAYGLHGLRLLRLATLLLGNEDDAWDVVQDAFERSLGALSRLSPDEMFPYLRRSVSNLAISRFRRRRVEQKFAPILAHTGRAAVQQTPVEDREFVWAAVRELPSRKRACVVLRYYEDLTQEEVASVLGCSVGTVRSQTSKALSLLRKVVGDEYRAASS